MKRSKKIKLTAAECKIYKAIMKAFPATNHLTALDAAIQGGIKFNFINK